MNLYHLLPTDVREPIDSREYYRIEETSQYGITVYSDEGTVMLVNLKVI